MATTRFRAHGNRRPGQSSGACGALAPDTPQPASPFLVPVLPLSACCSFSGPPGYAEGGSTLARPGLWGWVFPAATETADRVRAWKVCSRTAGRGTRARGWGRRFRLGRWRCFVQQIVLSPRPTDAAHRRETPVVGVVLTGPLRTEETGRGFGEGRRPSLCVRVGSGGACPLASTGL